MKFHVLLLLEHLCKLRGGNQIQFSLKLSPRVVKEFQKQDNLGEKNHLLKKSTVVILTHLAFLEDIFFFFIGDASDEKLVLSTKIVSFGRGITHPVKYLFPILGRCRLYVKW